jgi:DNA-binding transcriptional regulator YiaG/tetratricopeptide (TPR) repeat protein
MSPARHHAANTRLQQYRARWGLTQQETAEEIARLAWVQDGEAVAVNGDMVSKWERGKKRPSRRYRKLLCLAYQATEEQLGFRPTQPDGLAAPPVATELDELVAGGDVNRREGRRHAVMFDGMALVPRWLGSEVGVDKHPEIAGIRDALMRYDIISGAHSPDDVAPPDLLALRRAVDGAWDAFQRSRYSLLGAKLPGLLASTRRATWEFDGDQRLHASELLAETYQLMALLLLKFGDFNLAWVAADRGVLAAEGAENHLVFACGARILGYAFLGAGQYRQARQLTMEAARALETGLGTASPEHLSVYGALLLKGAMVAAHQGDRAGAREALAEAGVAARRLGQDTNYAHTAFGPTNVAVHRVSAAVALGDGGAAIAEAKSVHPGRLPVPERRAQHLLDLAQGYGQWGKDDQALRSLLAAEHLAPEEVQVQPASRALVVELLRRDRRRTPELRALAERVGALA